MCLPICVFPVQISLEEFIIWVLEKPFVFSLKGLVCSHHSDEADVAEDVSFFALAAGKLTKFKSYSSIHINPYSKYAYLYYFSWIYSLPYVLIYLEWNSKWTV